MCGVLRCNGEEIGREMKVIGKEEGGKKEERRKKGREARGKGEGW